jgi:hypothetical protein
MNDKTNKLEQKLITKEINKALSSGFNINTESDEDFLSKSTYNWDDLNKLKEELGISILEFIGQVNCAITNPDIINNLGDQKDHFNKVVNLFFSDINTFSHKVKDIRVVHEHLSGHINNINDFNNYNRIAIQYQALFSELATLITPTLSDLMLTINDVVKPTGPETINQEVISNGTN